MVFYSLIQSILDYASPLFLNANAYLDSKFSFLCKRAFRIIHGFDIKSCTSCDLLNVQRRRRFLAMKLFREALFSPSHVLHLLLPKFSHRSNRLILPFARTKRKTDSFVFSCSKLYNESLWHCNIIVHVYCYLSPSEDGPLFVYFCGLLRFPFGGLYCFEINAFYYYYYYY